MTTPISAVATARSTTQHDVQDLAAQVGLPAHERQRLTQGGLRSVPVATTGLVELVAEVLTELRREGWQPSTCTFAVFTHSLDLDEARLDELDSLLRAQLPHLDDPPLLVTGRPCSVLHLGVELAATQSRRDPVSTALVLGADVAPTHDDRFFFGSAMGDTAVGLVLGGAPRVGHLLSSCSTSRIIACEGVASPAEDIERFRAQNPTAIRAAISLALQRAGIGWDDLAAIVPHTPYRSIWDTIATLCRFPRDRILDGNLSRTGHLNSNDVMVHLAAALRDGRLRAGDVVALVSPGFGGTRGCTVIRISGQFSGE